MKELGEVAAAGVEGFQEAFEAATGQKLDDQAALVMLICAGAQTIADRLKGTRTLGSLTVAEFSQLTGAPDWERASAAARERAAEEERLLSEVRVATQTVREVTILVAPTTIDSPDEADGFARWARSHWQAGCCLVVSCAWAKARLPGQPGAAHPPVTPVDFPFRGIN